MKKKWLFLALLLCMLLALLPAAVFAAEITLGAEAEITAEPDAEPAEEEFWPEGFASDFTELLPEADLTAVGVSDETPVQAASSVAINATNFPDAVFRSYVSANFDTDGSGYLSAAEQAAVTEIDVNRTGVTSLQGIEYFSNLRKLVCYLDTQLTSLDLSQNTELTEIQCWSTFFLLWISRQTPSCRRWTATTASILRA